MIFALLESDRGKMPETDFTAVAFDLFVRFAAAEIGG